VITLVGSLEIEVIVPKIKLPARACGKNKLKIVHGTGRSGDTQASHMILNHVLFVIASRQRSCLASLAFDSMASQMVSLRSVHYSRYYEIQRTK
jgi:hypothetical protein